MTLTLLHSKVFDVGDLPVPTFGNCVLKTGVINWPLELYVRFLRFLQNPKKTVYVFLSCCTRLLQHCSTVEYAWCIAAFGSVTVIRKDDENYYITGNCRHRPWCPSVCLSQHGPTRSKSAAAGLLLWAQSAGDVDRLLQQRIRGFFKNDMRYINPRFTYLLTYLQRRAAAECGQCHVVSVRRKLETDLLFHISHSNTVYVHARSAGPNTYSESRIFKFTIFLQNLKIITFRYARYGGYV